MIKFLLFLAPIYYFYSRNNGSMGAYKANPTRDQINEIIDELKSQRDKVDRHTNPNKYVSLSKKISKWYRYRPESDEIEALKDQRRELNSKVDKKEYARLTKKIEKLRGNIV